MAEVINVNPNAKKTRNITIVIVVAALLLITLFSSLTIVEAGHKGVLLNMGAVTGKVLDEGMNFKIPFIQSVEVIDVRVKKIESTSNSSASKDMQNITSSIAVNYRIDSSAVDKLYKNIGLNYEATVISPAISECMKAVTSQYTAEELITKRVEVSAKMKQFLQEKLADKYITVDSFNIINFEFSDAYNKAIEEKQIAEQEALKAKYDLERIQIEADQAIKKAQGEAEAMKLKNEQLSDYIIKLEFIEKWDGKMPLYLGEGANLMLGMESGATAASSR